MGSKLEDIETCVVLVIISAVIGFGLQLGKYLWNKMEEKLW